jgi:hypothetical protein
LPRCENRRRVGVYEGLHFRNSAVETNKDKMYDEINERVENTTKKNSRRVGVYSRLNFGNSVVKTKKKKLS